jgi:hypothetical protein
MGDVFGADFLSNAKMLEPGIGSIDLPALSAMELPAFEENAPRLVPKFSEVNEVKTSEGLNNYNAEPLFPSPMQHRVSEEHILKEKSEILRKFDRLNRAGVPIRKRFTMDSSLEEMRSELEFIRKEKAMDQTVKQFCDWYITGMSALEWSTKNVAVMKAFGLNLNGLSESAQMNVVDMEDDFEELYDLYGDKLKMHPLVRIPIRTCMMVYMVHITNQMTLNAPIPNMDQILKTNPDIARQLASAAMQQQTQNMRPTAPPPPPPSNPLAGLSNFMSGILPPPQETNVRPQAPTPVKSAMKPKAQPPVAAAPAREMKPPTNIQDILKSINAKPAVVEQPKVVSTTPKKSGGSTGKNSVTIRL